jgi:hypothetical protein
MRLQQPPTLDLIEQLYSQTEGLDIKEDDEEPTDNDKKAKKKAKAKEITRLKKLGLQGVIEEAKLPKDVQFEPFDPGHRREPKVVNVPPNIDTIDPIVLLELFIPPLDIRYNYRKHQFIRNCQKYTHSSYIIQHAILVAYK